MSTEIETASQRMPKRILLSAGGMSPNSDPHEGGVRTRVETVGERRRTPADSVI